MEVYRIALYAGFHFAISPPMDIGACPDVETVDRPKRYLPTSRFGRSVVDDPPFQNEGTYDHGDRAK